MKASECRMIVSLVLLIAMSLVVGFGGPDWLVISILGLVLANLAWCIFKATGPP